MSVNGAPPLPVPHSPEAEASVIGQMLATPKLVGEVIGTLLEPGHFHTPAFRALYHEIVSAYYADDAIDPLTIGELCAKTLSRTWTCTEAEAIRQVQQLAAGHGFTGDAVAHAKVIKRHADYRALVDLAMSLLRSVSVEDQTPEDIAGLASQRAMQIATSTLLTHAIEPYDEIGRAFMQDEKQLMVARNAGLELGAYFGLTFLDSWIRGLRPQELLVLAGEPGAGKSALAWKAAQMFAERQMRQAPERRVGTLVLSLEMGQEASSQRLAQTVSGLDGGRLREGDITEDELARVMAEWDKRKGIPLYFNFASTMRASQMRALIVESIRRHNVGLVVIDHWRYFDMDGRWSSQIEEDEAKARWLKEDLAKELNLAVVCLAHTTKGIESTDDRRPRLSHLRGSGQVAAHADIVAFVYRPFKHAKKGQIESGEVKATDAELIYEKNRHGREGTAHFFFDPASMHIS